MPKKVRPSVLLDKEIQEVLQQGANPAPELDDALAASEGLLSDLLRLSLRRLLQRALEAELDDYLGRDYYRRGARREAGLRNGYEPFSLATAEGRIDLAAPQARGTTTTYRSRLRGRLPGLSENLRRLSLEAYVRGLSTRDVAETFVDERGRSLLSKDAVTELSAALLAEYAAFQAQPLGEYDVVYLFVDAVYESLRRQAHCKEAVLVAWGILSDGRKLLLSLSVGNQESQDAWREFFHAMIKRGLRRPLLVVSDGCPGLIAAINEVFAGSRRGRCIAHKLRNINDKLPKKLAPELLPEFRAVFYAADGDAARTLVAALVEKYAAVYPAAIKCLLDDLDACLAHLEFPESQRRYIRTTNLLERAFVEQRRRTKIIPGFFTEPSCMKLVFGTLIRASRHWRRVKMTPLELSVLRNIHQLMGGAEGSPFLSLEFRKAA